MSGFTTQNAKFIKPLEEKMSYDKSFDSCNSFGFTNQFCGLPLKVINRQKLNESLKRLGLQIHLPRDKYEQKFVNSLATYSSSWLRIKFDNNDIKTDDPFQGKTGCLLLKTEKC